MVGRDVTFAQIAQCAESVFCFTPEPFFYYLPGIPWAELAAGRWDSNAGAPRSRWLGRSPDPAKGDEFFRLLWTLLKPAEIGTLAAKVGWLKTVLPDVFRADAKGRGHQALCLLRELPARPARSPRVLLDRNRIASLLWEGTAGSARRPRGRNP